MKLATALRLGCCVIVATAIVLGVTNYIVVKTRKPAHSVMVTVVKSIDRMSMAEVTALTTDHSPKPITKPDKLPEPPRPEREVSGIVQVAFTVRPDGSATDVRVTGAAPEGYYEKQAKAQVANSYHKPKMGDDGRLHAHTTSKIFHFTMPAHDGDQSQSNGGE